ncbi:hypothetical protein OSTOST_02692, partial [Ostertagia ostertagi]
AESSRDFVPAACTQLPNLPECKVAKWNAQRNILLNRLETRRRQAERTVERRVFDEPLTDRQSKKLAEFMAMLGRLRRSGNKTEPAGEFVTKTHSDADLREKETGNGSENNVEEGFIPEKGEGIHRKLKVKETESEGTVTEFEHFNILMLRRLRNLSSPPLRNPLSLHRTTSED